MGPLFGFLGAVVFEVNWIYFFYNCSDFQFKFQDFKIETKNVQPAYAWSWTCGCTDSKQVLSRSQDLVFRIFVSVNFLFNQRVL